MAEFNWKNINRIVVRGTNWVGDAVMTVPALRKLRRLFPDAQVTLAIRSNTSGLFANEEFVDALQVHEGSGLRSVVQQVRQWRAGRFDLAILFPNSLETALVASLSRIPVRIGYATEGRQALLTHPINLPEWRSSKHEVFFYLNVIEELEKLAGRETIPETDVDCSLAVGQVRKEAALDFLRNKGVRDRRLVALCPGSTNSRAKRWPAERYAALGDRFVDEWGAEVLLIGSPGELEVSHQVAGYMRNKPVMLTGETGLAEVAAILSLVDLLVTNDTGPAHIASALGRPTLVIFGPTNPLTTRPFSPTGEIVRNPPDCAPCMLRDCPIDHRCMTAITPDEVFERASVMLSGKPGFVVMPQPVSLASDKLKFVGQMK